MSSPKPRTERATSGAPLPDRAPHAAPIAVRALRVVGRTLLEIPRSFAIVPVIAWMALIAWGSSQTLPPPTHPSAFGAVIWNMGHAPEFGILAMLLTLLLPRAGAWPRIGVRESAFVLLVVFAYATSDEIHQSFTPGRTASALDVLTDVTGGSLALRGVVIVGDGASTGARLASFVACGILACLAAAAIATFVPDWFPRVRWL